MSFDCRGNFSFFSKHVVDLQCFKLDWSVIEVRDWKPHWCYSSKKSWIYLTIFQVQVWFFHKGNFKFEGWTLIFFYENSLSWCIKILNLPIRLKHFCLHLLMIFVLWEEVDFLSFFLLLSWQGYCALSVDQTFSYNRNSGSRSNFVAFRSWLVWFIGEGLPLWNHRNTFPSCK